MPASAATLAAYTKLNQRALALAGEVKTLDAKARATLRQLDAAVKANDFETVNLQRKVLGVHQTQVGALYGRNEDLRVDTRELEKDREFLVSNTRDLANLTKLITGLQKVLDALRGDIDTMLSTATEAVDDATLALLKDGKDLKAGLNDCLLALARYAGDVDAAKTKAEAASKARDRPGLVKILDELDDSARKTLPPAATKLESVEASFREFVAKWPDWGKWSKATGDAVKMRDSIVSARDLMNTTSKRKAELDKLRPVPIDVRKAAKLLDVETHQDKLRRVLDAKTGNIERELDAFAKAVKLPKTGRQILDQLARAGLY